MRLPRIYIDMPLDIGLQLQLPPETTHHIHTVLRLTLADRLIIFNGTGGQYNASITHSHKKTVKVEINTFDALDNESPLPIHLGQCLSRQDRMDIAIQKAVELGVTEITPIIAEKSAFKINSKQVAKKSHHWQKIIISATEQSGRTQIPILHPCINYTPFISQISKQQTTRFICHPQGTQDLELTANSHPQCCVVLIGPESGFSDTEFAIAKQNNYYTLRLGPRTLRTETATIAALTAIQLAWGDLQIPQ